MPHEVSRRLVLTGLATAPVVACAPAPGAPASPPADPEIAELERRFDARVGLFARHAVTGKTVAHRPDEPAPLCSTFKVYATGALLRAHPLSTGYFDSLIRYTRADLVTNSPVTETRVDTGMTVAELCAAALQHSDNTAGNLLLRELGGPQVIAPFARTLGDPATRLDRWETELNSSIPGDPRDTTTPRAYAAGLSAMLLGDALGPPEREKLTDWMLGCATGPDRIRAGVNPGWRTADKTGGGSAYGVANDVAVTWTETGAPIVIALFTARHHEKDNYDNALLAEAARAVVERLV